MNRKVKNSASIIKKGDDQLKKAQKSAKGGWLSSPNWDDAAYSYRAAIKEYQKAGTDGHAKLLQALIESANAHEKIKSLNRAAKDMELAAKMTSKDPKNARQAYDHYVTSSKYYLSNQQHDKAADLLVTAGEILGKNDVNLSMQSLNEAFQIIDDEKRGLLGTQTMSKAISISLKLECMDEAVSMLKKLNKMYKESEDPSSRATDIYKNYLSILVILFHTEDYKTAEEEYKEADSFMAFSTSTEGEAAERMFSAYRAGSEDEWGECMKLKIFHYLPNQVSRMVKKLTLSDEILANPPLEEKKDDLYQEKGDEGDEGDQDYGADENLGEGDDFLR